MGENRTTSPPSSENRDDQVGSCHRGVYFSVTYNSPRRYQYHQKEKLDVGVWTVTRAQHLSIHKRLPDQQQKRVSCLLLL
jgi:hypothetical protein